MTNKRNAYIDIAKLILAIMVVIAHTNLLIDVDKLIWYLYKNGYVRITVPVFLMINGYYFYRIKEKPQFLTWLRRIVVNTAINHNRKKLYQQPMLDIDNTFLHIEKELVLSHLHFLELLAMMQKLPTGSRTVFNLFAIEGYGHKEIAEMLDISEGTSKSQYARAKALLKVMIEEANQVVQPITSSS